MAYDADSDTYTCAKGRKLHFITEKSSAIGPADMNGPYEFTNVKTVSIVENGINASRPVQERNQHRINGTVQSLLPILIGQGLRLHS